MLKIVQHCAFAACVVAALALLAWLFAFGGAGRLALWAAGEQREVQNALAMGLRAVRAGEPWAVSGLLAACFSYGFLHAAGPGHGKLVMGGYALAEAVTRRRLALLTLAGALGQAVTAILLVSAGAWLFGWGRTQMQGWADGTLAATSMAAIALVGLWLVWRGARRLVPSRRRDLVGLGDASHHHHHDHDHACGHVHGPDPAAVAAMRGWRDGLALVGAVAIRPCTGALFLLILTYGMGLAWLGMLGALVMGLGTAMLTLAVAFGASGLRDGLAVRLAGPAGAQAMAGLEVLAGSAVALIAGQAALRLF